MQSWWLHFLLYTSKEGKKENIQQKRLDLVSLNVDVNFLQFNNYNKYRLLLDW